MTGSAILEIKDLRVSYDGTRAVDGVSLMIAAGGDTASCLRRIQWKRRRLSATGWRLLIMERLLTLIHRKG